MMPTPPATPRWFIAVIVMILLPVFQFPILLDSCTPGSSARTMVWIYPFYAITAAWLAYQCYSQRPVLAWILLALMLLSHIAVFMLVTMPLN